MSRQALIISLLFVAACEWGGGAGPTPSGRIYMDAPTVLIDSKKTDGKVMIDAKKVDAFMRKDAPPVDAPVVTGGGHLLLTEVALSPDGGEFVEILNPTNAMIDLSHYYLSNHGDYWQYPIGAPNEPSSHWIIQFQTATTIAPGAVITIAIDTSANFNAVYGVMPTYSLGDGTMLATDVGGVPHLTDSGALVALFNWDAVSTIVKDVDIMVVGQPTATNQLLCSGCGNKSGMMQGSMTFATDADTIPAQSSTPGTGMSTKRIQLEAGFETATGGNGFTGHDETSEDTSQTWDSTFTTPTPGTVPSTI